MLTTDLTYATCTLLCAGIGAIHDVARHRIPNLLTAPAILFGLLLHSLLGGWQQLASSTVAGLLCGVIFLVFYLSGGMGAGDVKLMTAAGCISGLSLSGYLLIWTALSGGVMALLLALYHHRLKETLRNVCSLVGHHGANGFSHHPKIHLGNEETLRLPYALAIAAGSGLTLCLLIVRG